ncbi:MAG: lipopolysaccharide export system permease protein [Verrucomicrobia bacterium]|jgi:lipopolysaccharide export system permease protein|nr:MAG: lipopolysaccharide export system permease protein [Verrucomicrobiota bacterium]
MLKIFDRYLGKQLVFSTFFAVFVLSMVLVLGNVFQKLISKLDEHPELGWGFVLEFMLNVLPFSLIFTIPWGMLTSILLIYGRLSADNELTALRMAGLSMWRICTPVFTVGLIATAASFWLNTDIAPKSQSRIAQVFFRIATQNPGAMFINDEVINSLPGYLLYTEERQLLDDGTGRYRLKNLQMVKLSGRARPDIFIRAAEGIIGFDPGNMDDLIMELEDAHIEKAESDDQTEFQLHHYVKPGHATLQISLAALRERHRKTKPSFMTLTELRQKVAGELDPALKSSYLTEMHKRLSLSLACITFCLVGVPLGVTAQRRETSIGFALSMIIAICYFVFIIVADSFSDSPAAFPHLLMWLPNIVFMSLGAVMFARLSRK